MQTAFFLVSAEDPMPESAGDEPPQAGSFDELVEQHTRVLFRIALGVLRRPADAEDAVQEAFLEIYRNNRWKHIDNPRAYLAQMVWRIAIRRQSARRREQELTVDIRSGKPGPEQQAIGRQLDAWLHAEIAALPDKLRHPLVLMAAGDLNQAEIARLLGLPEGTVRRRMHEARARLRQRLGARKGEEHGRED
jgi:RNA polymerase sigma-70 factor (ECF subfamily)